MYVSTAKVRNKTLYSPHLVLVWSNGMENIVPRKGFKRKVEPLKKQAGRATTNYETCDLFRSAIFVGSDDL